MRETNFRKMASDCSINRNGCIFGTLSDNIGLFVKRKAIVLCLFLIPEDENLVNLLLLLFRQYVCCWERMYNVSATGSLMSIFQILFQLHIDHKNSLKQDIRKKSLMIESGHRFLQSNESQGWTVKKCSSNGEQNSTSFFSIKALKLEGEAPKKEMFIVVCAPLNFIGLKIFDEKGNDGKSISVP